MPDTATLNVAQIFIPELCFFEKKIKSGNEIVKQNMCTQNKIQTKKGKSIDKMNEKWAKIAAK